MTQSSIPDPSRDEAKKIQAGTGAGFVGLARELANTAERAPSDAELEHAHQRTQRAALHRRVDNDFVYHTPTRAIVPIFADIRNQARYFAHSLIESCPPGRELSLALTSLEEAVMWANAGIARQAPPDQPATQTT